MEKGIARQKIMEKVFSPFKMLLKTFPLLNEFGFENVAKLASVKKEVAKEFFQILATKDKKKIKRSAMKLFFKNVKLNELDKKEINKLIEEFLKTK